MVRPLLLHLVLVQGSNTGHENLAHTRRGHPWAPTQPGTGLVALRPELGLVSTATGICRAAGVERLACAGPHHVLGRALGRVQSISAGKAVLARRLGWHSPDSFSPPESLNGTT